ncbi:MAG: deoxyguanosinetriphosphate triphosphohydrolase [Methylibium sp.]|uniref:deoxyguanosinetriphosphate triphosphohydrolase n=1 Tax=Methylibium sp. TaxID=2067992 RepID=UPI00183ADE8A|nr:deoxyguanosinetriphosphate triphosphohydrolase [Methylibium sp.]MBA3597566.1 deoxyguanosinetriphosphate triphosphohydrolase [Methylibium sp.]
MALAPYASDPALCRGRRHPEPPAPTRDDYQRDRDRIVHSTAFRRLVYKTQVFLNHEGDLFRTRLTHSLEVAQLARSIARALGLNEDLVEAIALAHDLGHTPFGHAGQDALDRCLRNADPGSGGFEHNLQSLRVVDQLEERYADFDGLNLSFETREGILKHCSGRHAKALEAVEPGGVARRFIDGTQPSLEAQLCNLADEIAYNAHDVDDGVRSGLIGIEQLEEVPLVSRCLAQVRDRHPGLTGRRLLYETLRRLLSVQVYDVIDASRVALATLAPADADAARLGPAMICFSPSMRQESAALKRFLFRCLYRHPQVLATTERAQGVVQELFEAFDADAAEWPQRGATGSDRYRALADHIAGMTDRYALREHRRMTGRDVFEAEPRVA